MTPRLDRRQGSALALGVLLLVSLGIAAGTVQSTVSDPAARAPDAEGGRNQVGGGGTPGGEDALPSGPEDDDRIEWLNDSGTPTGGELSGGADDAGDVVSVVTSPVGGLGLLVLLGVLAVGLAIRSAGRGGPDAGEDDNGEDEAADDGTLADVGRAAERAADRLDESDPDNAVYEAWLEMTRLLAVDDPTTSTPGEFATAAVDAGMARADVERLTSVFEGVRYGGADPTAEREREARAAFRRIEQAYGDDAGRASPGPRPNPTGADTSTGEGEDR